MIRPWPPLLPRRAGRAALLETTARALLETTARALLEAAALAAAMRRVELWNPLVHLHAAADRA
jgi:hypothetical protein